MIGTSNRLPARIQRALAGAGVILLDVYLEDLTQLAKGLPFDETTIALALPSKYLPRYDLLFAKAFLACISTVVWKLQSPDQQELACVAEELALSTIIGRAEALFELRGKSIDLGQVYEEAFQDTDFEFIFAAGFDGIEESEIAEHLHFANLRFEDWFKPFANVPYVHPYVADASRATHRPRG